MLSILPGAGAVLWGRGRTLTHGTLAINRKDKWTRVSPAELWESPMMLWEGRAGTTSLGLGWRPGDQRDSRAGSWCMWAGPMVNLDPPILESSLQLLGMQDFMHLCGFTVAQLQESALCHPYLLPVPLFKSPPVFCSLILELTRKFSCLIAVGLQVPTQFWGFTRASSAVTRALADGRCSC